MTDRERTENSSPKEATNTTRESSGALAKPSLTRDSNPPVTESESDLSKELTPEEQMALYEKELKENDWGHQPC